MHFQEGKIVGMLMLTVVKWVIFALYPSLLLIGLMTLKQVMSLIQPFSKQFKLLSLGRMFQWGSHFVMICCFIRVDYIWEVQIRL